MGKDLSDFVGEFGEIGNHPELPDVLARAVSEWPRLINWIDGHGTRMTVLFARPTRHGFIPGFGPSDRVLYVAVEGYGSYGFAVKDEPIAPGYIAEKLGRRNGRDTVSVNPTWEALADLVGGVRQALARQL